MINITLLDNSLLLNEGYRRMPYRDHKGVWTIGKGINIHGMAIPSHCVTLGDFLDWLTDGKRHEEWYVASRNGAIQEAKQWIGGEAWRALSELRKRTIAEMSYQLGIIRLKRFEKFLAALVRQDYAQAASEMRDSDVWRDPKTHSRWEQLAQHMEKG